jgi:hypothetical protein
MTAVAGNIASQYNKKAAPPKGDRLQLSADIAIGSAGAVGTTNADDPVMVLTKNGGTGDYTLAFPTSPKGRILALYVVSAALTIKGVGIVSFDATTGALNFITQNGGGTATNPASGDVIHVSLDLDTRG